MTEMREWWANVYAEEPGCDTVGAPHLSRLEADENACRGRYARIHVRLKPEGAPKRYSSPQNRFAWEDHGPTCRQCVHDGADPREIHSGRWGT